MDYQDDGEGIVRRIPQALIERHGPDANMVDLRLPTTP
jgi:hypothetical protein